MNKKQLSERDICTKFITPSIVSKGWDKNNQIREEVSFTKGRIIVYGKTYKRGINKRADYILYHKPNLPIAVIEAKDNNSPIGDGMQQALDYAGTLDILFAFSSNGDGFIFHDKTTGKETQLKLEEFPTPKELWEKYKKYKEINEKVEDIIT